MCGVIGLIYQQQRDDLGRVAADLLKLLEYRGYDSTGGAFQGDDGSVTLLKGVGAPSVVVDELGIREQRGRIFCGQVRWATFGAVTQLNSQPHHARCKADLYGAHNGNVTNCDGLKTWLVSEGHDVLSENDGEMVVHAVEHYYAIELEGADELVRYEPEVRRRCLRAAVVRAARRLEGSYAAVIVDPATHTAWALKQGSSLYFGIGEDDRGSFSIASSDLSSVLKLTRVVVPISEGEFVEYDAEGYQVYTLGPRTGRAEADDALAAGEPLERQPVRSRLRAKDTALLPAFDTFMDQEISAQEQTVARVATLFDAGSPAARALDSYVAELDEQQLAQLDGDLEKLRDQYADEAIRDGFRRLVARGPMQQLVGAIPASLRSDVDSAPASELVERLSSSDAGFFADLLPMARTDDERLAVRLLDLLVERHEVDDFRTAAHRFASLCLEALQCGGRIFVVCCGSSYHAAKAAALFFNEIAATELVPILPGEFRAQVRRSLRDGDLFIAISQSGETKDLIDVLDSVLASKHRIARVGVVNNVSSTLAQEKCDLVIPLRCGPEIAVPATKSFVNQMAVLYGLALELAKRRSSDQPPGGSATVGETSPRLELRRERLGQLPELIRETFDSTETGVEMAAQMLYLAPSIHLLATRISAVAKEGALKIREVVLNHTEGFEGSEFKHGPNTILGFNTLFGPSQLEALLSRLGQIAAEVANTAFARGWGAESAARLVHAVSDAPFSPSSKRFSLEARERELLERMFDRDELLGELYADYPLIYVTGPEPTDVALTVAQINTHKIRGASTVVIAEDHPALREAASRAPADNPAYRSVYITLPRTGDTLMTVFSATVVLQRLALKMSALKMAYLDRLGIPDHGVHPDVPKNVSKSITVD